MLIFFRTKADSIMISTGLNTSTDIWLLLNCLNQCITKLFVAEQYYGQYTLIAVISIYFTLCLYSMCFSKILSVARNWMTIIYYSVCENRIHLEIHQIKHATPIEYRHNIIIGKFQDYFQIFVNNFCIFF